MAKDFLSILKEVRGTGAPEATYTDGIYWELTMELHNGNPGVYGDILAIYADIATIGAQFDDFLIKYADFLTKYADVLVMYADIQDIQIAVNATLIDVQAAATASELAAVNALASESASAISASESAVSATASDVSAVASAASAVEAAVSETAAGVSETNAAASEAASSVSEGNANDSELLAEKYATYPEGQVIPGTTDLSSLHYAAKSEDFSLASAASAVESEDSATASALSAVDAADQAGSILAMTADANTLVAGSQATASYNSGTGIMLFGVPEGAEGAKGDPFTIDAQGPIADRGLYNHQPDGFSFLSLDEAPNKIYFKIGDATADSWSTGSPFGIGATGATGVGISGINLVVGSQQPGETDTYRITYTDASTLDYFVYNGDDGNSLTSLTFTSTTDGSGLPAKPGATDTYTITYSDAVDFVYSIYNGIDGNSIVSNTFTSTTDSSGLPGQPGGTDTYTIVYTDIADTTYEVYNGVNGAVDGIREYFTATAGQTEFILTSTYTVGQLDVYRNGIRLQIGTDVTVSNGTSAVLTVGATLGDVIETYGYGVFSVADAYTQGEVDALLLPITDDVTAINTTLASIEFTGEPV